MLIYGFEDHLSAIIAVSDPTGLKTPYFGGKMVKEGASAS
jgi:hypothetical protein